MLVLSNTDVFSSVLEVALIDDQTASAVVVEDLDVLRFPHRISIVQPRDLYKQKFDELINDLLPPEQSIG